MLMRDKKWHRLLPRVCLALLLIATYGCSQTPARIEAPSISDHAGAAAVAEFDRDGDGAISGTELNAAPSVKAALRRIDINSDGKVTADEIDARIKAWRDTKIGLLRATVTVLKDGQPVSGAEVRLKPEAFLGTALQSATATTNESGMASLRVSDDPRGVGAQLGLYRIEVSKKSGDLETIPVSYNAETELGVEIALDNPTIEKEWTLKLRGN